MKFKIYAAIISILALSACNDNVPTVDDPNNIVVDGKKMKQAEFLDRYCAGKSDNETCMKVLKAKRYASTRGEMPKW